LPAQFFSSSKEIFQTKPFLDLVRFPVYSRQHKRIGKKMLPRLKEEGAVFIDVRTESEFSSNHAPCTVNIPLNRLNEECKKLSKDFSIVVCCASGTRSGMAKGILKKNGFQKIYNAGGWTTLLS
jgi:rhodanese-related sulfurtransferase